MEDVITNSGNVQRQQEEINLKKRGLTIDKISIIISVGSLVIAIIALLK